MYGTEAYLYDHFSLRIVDNCTDFTWADTTSSAPSDFTFTIYPTAVDDTLTISLPLVSGTTCDDDPTVTWWYMEIGGNTWYNLTDTNTTDHVTNSSDTTLTFNGTAWDWGYQADGQVLQSWKVQYEADHDSSVTMEWEFTVIY
jgi:hypothetical protein